MEALLRSSNFVFKRRRMPNDTQNSVARFRENSESRLVWARSLDQPLAPKDLSIDRKVLYEVVAVACVNETMNGAILVHTYQRARWPSIKLTARTLLDEKLAPSRLGWSHLDGIRAHTDFGWITKYLVPMMDAMGVDALVAAASQSPEAAPLSAYGELSDGERLKIFEEVMTEIVLPAFSERGIHTQTAQNWLKTRLGRQ